MKWLLVLLALLGGGVAWAAFSVPTNAAVVNGSSISQASLNSDISAIASSAEYQCYLNSEDYISSNGSQQGLPPVSGAGKGQNEADNPTANSSFVANYLETRIGYELVQQLADSRNITVDSAQLADARASFTSHISATMSEVSQTAQGENPRFSCGAVTAPLTGEEVLKSLPSSFVDEQVHFIATSSALNDELAGVGASESDLEGFFERHRAEFDTACFNAAEFSSQSAASAAQAAVDYGTPFSQVAANATQSGTIPCAALVVVAGELGTDVPSLQDIAVGKASAPINVQGNYVVLELSKRSPTTYAAAKSIVSQVVQNQGASATGRAINAAERRSSVTIDPRYGTWKPVLASVSTPPSPELSDVLNAPANEATLPVSKSPFSG